MLAAYRYFADRYSYGQSAREVQADPQLRQLALAVWKLQGRAMKLKQKLETRYNAGSYDNSRWTRLEYQIRKQRIATAFHNLRLRTLNPEQQCT